MFSIWSVANLQLETSSCSQSHIHLLAHTRTHSLADTHTHTHTHSLTHSPTHSHTLTHTSTRFLSNAHLIPHLALLSFANNAVTFSVLWRMTMHSAGYPRHTPSPPEPSSAAAVQRESPPCLRESGNQAMSGVGWRVLLTVSSLPHILSLSRTLSHIHHHHHHPSLSSSK